MPWRGPSSASPSAAAVSASSPPRRRSARLSPAPAPQAWDNGIPFYVALPAPTIACAISDGLKDIEIEERAQREVTHLTGRMDTGSIETIQITAPGSPALNPAFDVTPARLVTARITERGVAPASREGLLSLYPERRATVA